jgi:putative transposase
MGHKYPNILVHLVFSTKERRNLIPPELQSKLPGYVNGIGKNTRLPVLAAGGTANHLHVLVALPTDIPVSKAVQVLKANSSRWIGEHGFEFQWQEGYGAFSVSASNRDAVIDYIDHQTEHHTKRDFEQEFVAMLTKAGLAFNHDEVFD